MFRFIDYVTEQDAQDVGPAITPPGESQRDPDAPSRIDKLISSLKEIMQLAKRAIEEKESGLADKTGNQEPGKEHPTDMNNLVTRPKSDSAASLFGQD